MTQELIEHFTYVSKFYKKSAASSFNSKHAIRKYLSNLDLNEKWVFSREQEFRFFSALHFLKYRIQKAIKRNRTDQSLKWMNKYMEIRNKITTANIGLAYKMCMSAYFDRFKKDADEMIATATECLFRCVDFFDPWTKFKFSTYASNSIFRQIYREHIDKNRHFVNQSSYSEDMSFDDFISIDSNDFETPIDGVENIKYILKNNVAELDDREQRVVNELFGFFNKKDNNLKQLGKEMHMSHETVRLIKESALKKLRDSLALAS